MKTLIRTFPFALCALSHAGTAQAVEAMLAPMAPVVHGTPASFEVTAITEAVGGATLHWKFGDGTTLDATPDAPVSHQYAGPGQYTVTVVVSDESGARKILSGRQKVHLPLTAGKPTQSSTVIFDATRSRVWNVNPDNGSVTVSDLDGTNLTPLREIPVGSRPRSLALAPDGTVWVTAQHSWEIVVLDGDSGVELSRIAAPYASQPYGIAFAPSGRAYVSLYALGKVLELDPATRTITGELTVGPTPAGIGITHDGRILVTRFISPDEEGQVYELTAPGNGSLSIVRTIALPFDPGPDDESNSRGVPNYVSQVVISPDGTQAWVTAKKDNIARGPQRDGLSMEADSFVRAITCVIDLATNTERMAQRMDLDNRSLPISVAFSDYGDYALVLTLGTNWVGFQNAYGAENLGGIRDVGLAPDGLVLIGNRLVVHGFLSRTLRVYDVSQVLSGEDETAPDAAETIRTVSQEVLSESVLAGKQLFHNAADGRMSAEGYMSCAACHLEGLHDGRVWDLTDRGEGLRNTRSLIGIRGAVGHGRVHWSANFDEIQDFERDIRESLGGIGFMTDAAWVERAADPFGLPSAGVSPDLDNLAAYIESLANVQPSPYRNPDGSYTEAALRGREVYLTAGCIACHREPEYTDSGSGVLHDVGTLLPSSGSRLGGDLPGIDTPSLKGLWQSGPYLHDGRAATLKEIWTRHNPNDRIGVTSNLSDAQLDDLVAYLMQIDDHPVQASGAPGPVSSAATGANRTPQAQNQSSQGGCATARGGTAGGTDSSGGWSWAVLAGAWLVYRGRRRRQSRRGI